MVRFGRKCLVPRTCRDGPSFGGGSWRRRLLEADGGLAARTLSDVCSPPQGGRVLDVGGLQRRSVIKTGEQGGVECTKRAIQQENKREKS